MKSKVKRKTKKNNILKSVNIYKVTCYIYMCNYIIRWRKNIIIERGDVD